MIIFCKHHQKTRRDLPFSGFVIAIHSLVDFQKCRHLFLNQIPIFSKIFQTRIIHTLTSTSVYVLSNNSINFTIKK